MNPSEKGEGLVSVGIILCRKSMYFLPGLWPWHFCFFCLFCFFLVVGWVKYAFVGVDDCCFDGQSG